MRSDVYRNPTDVTESCETVQELNLWNLRQSLGCEPTETIS